MKCITNKICIYYQSISYISVMFGGGGGDGVGFDHYIINFELIFKINLLFISQSSIAKCFCKMFNNIFTSYKMMHDSIRLTVNS